MPQNKKSFCNYLVACTLGLILMLQLDLFQESLLLVPEDILADEIIIRLPDPLTINPKNFSTVVNGTNWICGRERDNSRISTSQVGNLATLVLFQVSH